MLYKTQNASSTSTLSIAQSMLRAPTLFFMKIQDMLLSLSLVAHFKFKKKKLLYRTRNALCASTLSITHNCRMLRAMGNPFFMKTQDMVC